MEKPGRRYFRGDTWEEILQQRHLREDTPVDTIERRYFSIDTPEEILKQIHFRGDTSEDTPGRRYSSRGT